MKQMTPARYRQIGQLFDEALEKPEEEREGFLDCIADVELRAAVRRLLSHEGSSENFLATGPPAAFADDTAVLGESIGPYTLNRVLGEGGMGKVFLATQSEPIRREVALKVIKPGMDSKAVLSRFDSERRALALMDHTNIAQVFDAGTTSKGLPYFVMELVDGEPVTSYCVRKDLTPRERVALFIPVCQAIQHAHQKGIIHRDIKPSNVLVREVDGKAIPKVIDFGLAKALGPSLSDATVFVTRIGTVLGTLQYMSPEQAELGSRNIDTRSDVYSLGALLYELLSGHPPFEPGAQETYTESLRRIREEEPVAPGDLGAKLSVKRIAAELDWIPLKALEKERSRRYQTVNDLVLDLDRFLAGEPVEAAPPSRIYRTSKFLRRHWRSFAVASTLVAALIGGAVVSAVMAVRATRAERQAIAVNDFLRNDVLAQADPASQTGPTKDANSKLTVREALDRASANIAGKFRGHPELEASIRETMAASYIGLTEYSRAHEQAERALELRQKALGENDRLTLRSREVLTKLLDKQGKYPEAAKQFAALLEVQRRILGDGDVDTLQTVSELGPVYTEASKPSEAEALLKMYVPIAERSLGADHRITLRMHQALAENYAYMRRSTEAVSEQQVVVQGFTRLLGPTHPETLRTMMALATYEGQLGHAEAKEATYKRILAAQRRIYGTAHVDTLGTMMNLAITEIGLDKLNEAEALLMENLAARKSLFADDHPRSISVRSVLSSLYWKQGKKQKARELVAQVFEDRRRVLGAYNVHTLKSMMDLATYLRETEPAKAEALYRENLSISRQHLGDSNMDTAVAAMSVIELLDIQRRYAEGEAVALQMQAAYRPASPDPVGSGFLELWQARMLVGLGREREADLHFRHGYETLVAGKFALEWAEYFKEHADHLVQFYTSRPDGKQWKLRVSADYSRLFPSKKPV